jgi:hypothetical protein
MGSRDTVCYTWDSEGVYLIGFSRCPLNIMIKRCYICRSAVDDDDDDDVKNMKKLLTT